MSLDLVHALLAAAVSAGLALGCAGLLRRNAVLLVGAAFVVLTVCGFAVSAIGLS